MCSYLSAGLSSSPSPCLVCNLTLLLFNSISCLFSISFLTSPPACFLFCFARLARISFFSFSLSAYLFYLLFIVRLDRTLLDTRQAGGGGVTRWCVCVCSSIIIATLTMVVIIIIIPFPVVIIIFRLYKRKKRV